MHVFRFRPCLPVLQRLLRTADALRDRFLANADLVAHIQPKDSGQSRTPLFAGFDGYEVFCREVDRNDSTPFSESVQNIFC